MDDPIDLDDPIAREYIESCRNRRKPATGKQRKPRKPRPRQNLTGLRVGRLTVTGYAGPVKWGDSTISGWTCRCDCGNTVTVPGPSLLKANTRSCGCLRRENNQHRKTKQ